MLTRVLLEERAQAFRDAGWWQDRTLDAIATSHPGSGPAITDHRATLDHADLAARVDAAARWIERVTLPGEVVAVQDRGSSDLLVLHLACSRTDRVLMPLAHVLTPAESAHLLDVAAAAVLVVPDLEDRGDAMGPAEHRDGRASLRLVGTPLGEGDFSLAAILGGAVPAASGIARPGVMDPDRPHLAMVSSGSTKAPKVSVWTDNDLWFLLSQYAARVDLVASDTVLQVAPAGAGSTGYVFPVLAPVLFGAHSVLLGRWSAAAALDAIERHRITVATAVPAQMVKMVRLQQEQPRDVTTLRSFNNAGARLGEKSAREVESVLGCRVQTSYGASDGGVPVLTSIHDEDDARLGSVGRPLPGVHLRIVDEDGVDVPTGDIGEVWWRTPSKTFGYLNEPEQDADSFTPEGYYRSGDLGELDASGCLHIVGRTREMIIRGGLNINPGEVEDAIHQHPAVSEAAVLGVPDPVLGQRTAAVVVLQPTAGLNLPDLCDFLQEAGLARHKLPEVLHTWTTLPHNNGGKVDKKSLLAAITPG